ncbi:protein KRTCAP2 homolog [Limulus polyphemus]|uniref:Protein KRTCAP2 homolog n=1 Tax=Limulus polyphemus TaxID=6850 RepID=A0ABM1C5L0_LIMPO|nr:protein KRTCAP2 homolog [Limulus polyphemus]
MAVSSGVSCLLSLCLFFLLFAGMQVYKTQLSASQWMTVFGGYLGSLLFILILTAIGNLETSLFGKNFQTKLFPEVALCLLIAMFASGMVHRVCITTCFLFSLLALYYLNRISIKAYGQPVSNKPAPIINSKKKKH